MKFAVDILNNVDKSDNSNAFKVEADTLEGAVIAARERREQDGFKGEMKVHMLDSRGAKKPSTELRFDLKLRGYKTEKTVFYVTD